MPVKGPSYGGPDNWAAATAMAAMIEGLAGVKDAPNSQAFQSPVLAPRWNATKVDTIDATIRYAPSTGYVTYRYIHLPDERKIKLTATTGGRAINCRMLVPNDSKPKKVEGNGALLPFTTSIVENSMYLNFKLDPLFDHELLISY